VSAPSPEDPIRGLMNIAVELHEFFTSLVAAGFDRQQAMTLTASFVQGMAQRGA
jgi:hypothetical protein